MLRKTLRSSARLFLSAAISWTLIPIAVADAPDKSTTEQHKRLHTIPEDGMGDKQWLSGANSIVRAIMAKRPDEDLVICVAGCVAQDRVVYAQPAEMPAPKVDETAAADQSEKAAVPVAKSEPAADAEKAEADKAHAAAKEALKPGFEPTASEPMPRGPVMDVPEEDRQPE